MTLNSANSAPLEPGEKVPDVSVVDSDDKAFDVTAYLKQGMTLVFFFSESEYWRMNYSSLRSAGQDR